MTVEIPLVIRLDDPAKQAIAFADGTTETVPGQLLPREKWIWLPRSQIEISDAGPASTGDRIVDVAMPEWLAKKHGLI